LANGTVDKKEAIKEEPAPAPKNVKMCASKILKMDLKKEMFLVGDIFMRKFYTIFDRDHNRIGLAKAVVPRSV